MKIPATTALLAVALLTGRAPALPTTQPDAAANAPATQPSQDIAALISQLGADDFHARRDAGLKLKQMGSTAVPALKEARLSKDPEIQARADELLQEIEEPTVVDEALPEAAGGPGTHSMSMSFSNGLKTTDIHENGRTIHIEQSAAGIKMTVNGQIDGKDVTREYRAQNAEKLQKQHPRAFAVYRQYGGGGAFGVGGIQIQAGGGIGINNIQIRANNNAGGGAHAVPNVAPGANGTLGITAGQTDEGVVALRVIPDSRADKMGLKEHDIIKKINGKEIHTIVEVQKAMAENPRELVLEALREGNPVTLTEQKKTDAVESKKQ